MTDRQKNLLWIRRTAFAGASALTGLSLLFLVANSWGQAPPPAQGAPAAKGGASASQGNDPDASTARDRLDVLEAQLEAKRTLLRIDESRLEQAKRWKAYYEKLVREGRVIDDRMVAARDDVLMLDAHVVAERADLKVAEIRAKNARRRAESGSPSADSAGQSREELDVLEALLEAKRSLLRASEARAEQTRRTEVRYEKLFRGGTATEDLVLAAKDDVLLIDSILAWARADLKLTEMRVEKARRAVSNGGRSADGAGLRLATLEEHLALAEMKVNVLQHEVGRLRRELPRETHGAR